MSRTVDSRADWDHDIARSVREYNRWFRKCAPAAFRRARERARKEVELAWALTSGFRTLDVELLRQHPTVLRVLRLCTAPPLAIDRLVGLAGTSRSIVGRLEEGYKLTRAEGLGELKALAATLTTLFDPEMRLPARAGLSARGAVMAVLADRVATVFAAPEVRAAQERRQLAKLIRWLNSHRYRAVAASDVETLESMPRGTFARMNVSGGKYGGVRVPIDMVVQPRRPRDTDLPVFIEAKSAGDFANVNKRKKEEASKMSQLREHYGRRHTKYVVLLGGYFDRRYLDYVTGAGIEVVWEHRLDGLRSVGL